MHPRQCPLTQIGRRADSTDSRNRCDTRRVQLEQNISFPGLRLPSANLLVANLRPAQTETLPIALGLETQPIHASIIFDENPPAWFAMPPEQITNAASGGAYVVQ